MAQFYNASWIIWSLGWLSKQVKASSCLSIISKCYIPLKFLINNIGTLVFFFVDYFIVHEDKQIRALECIYVRFVFVDDRSRNCNYFLQQIIPAHGILHIQAWTHQTDKYTVPLRFPPFTTTKNKIKYFEHSFGNNT